jgi:hypothetical protein
MRIADAMIQHAYESETPENPIVGRCCPAGQIPTSGDGIIVRGILAAVGAPLQKSFPKDPASMDSNFKMPIGPDADFTWLVK